MLPIRIYADTSVYGGVFDVEFEKPSRMFFDQVRQGRFALIMSPLIQNEVEPAPIQVRNLFDEAVLLAELVTPGEADVELRSAYVAAGIVGPASMTDAAHVALATVAKCVAIVSWNFKHIVHFEKVPRYNAVNTLMGYGNIGIYSPAEVVAYEKRL